MIPLKFAKFRLRALIVFYAVLFCFAADAAAQTISSKELINEAKDFDGKVVTFKGEVIGDVMMRGKYAWINVNDGINAVGIWSDKGLMPGLLYTGSYRFIGDEIEVEGVFHRSCPNHGGDLDIHAQFIRKTASGREVPEQLNFQKMKIMLALSVVSVIFFISDMLAARIRERIPHP